MDGMSKLELERAEARDAAIGPGPLRPRDAATLILLDLSSGVTRVLMGRRHRRHAFMPGLFVFPGGRTDPADGRIAVADEMHPLEQARVAAARGSRTPGRARAIALSAIRETYEEAGLLIGTRRTFSTGQKSWQGFADHGVAPSLAKLRVVARAVTPPGRVRRFDTIFFAAWRDAVVVELPQGGPSGELEELAWLTFAEARDLDLPHITKAVLADVEQRLVDDPELGPGGPAPYYRMIRGRFVRDIL